MKSFLHGGATKSRENQPLFKVTTSDGNVEKIYVDGYVEGMTPPMVRLGTFPDIVLRKMMSRPLTQNIDQMVDHVVKLAASQYGQDSTRIRDALLYSLSIAKIELRDIHSIEYNGAVESMPPQHRFIVTTKNNSTTVIYSP